MTVPHATYPYPPHPQRRYDNLLNKTGTSVAVMGWQRM